MVNGAIKDKLKKFPLHSTFILLFLWFVFTKNIFSFLIFCLTVFTHEMGHYYVAKKLGYKLDNFYIASYGVSLNYKEALFEQKDEILIAVAGPLVNFILSILAISFWWIFPSSYAVTAEFVFQSFMLGLFNLLPCYPLDGGRIFVGLLSKNLPRKRAIKFSMIINVVVSIILFILFFISFFFVVNPSLCFCGIFMILGLFESKREGRYQPTILYKKKTKNFSKPFFYVINGDVTLGQAIKKIEINRFTIFIVNLSCGATKTVDEQKLKLLSLKFSFSTTFDEIFS